MKPSFVKRIIKEDFPPEVQDWIDILLYPLNQHIEQTDLILNKNISLSDNVVAVLKSLTVTGTSLVKGDSTEGSNIIANAQYYSAFINGVQYGIQEGQTFQGDGVKSGTTVYSVSNTNISLSQPVLYTQKNADFVTGGNFPLSFAHGLAVRPSVVLIVKVEDNSSLGTLQTQAFSPQWELNGNNVVIKAIPGLCAGRQYTITFLMI